MYEKEEEKLAEMKERYEKLSVPDRADNYIQAGIQQAVTRKKRTRKVTFSSLAVGLMVCFLLFSIRISPAFASYVSQVPGLEGLVELVQGDKGLEAAIENSFVQVIDKSATHNGITFTVDEIIADESRLIIFYLLESENDLAYISLSDLEINNAAGESIMGSSGFDQVNGLKKGKPVKGRLNVGLKEGIDHPEKLEVKINMEAGLSGETPVLVNDTWGITFPVDQAKFFGNEETYEVKKTVNIEGQKITFKEVMVYPTRIAVHVKYDEQNTKQLFAFDDLAIVDEKGEEWASIINGVTAEHISDNEKILYLQSNYFAKPKEMYITFSSIRALEKDKLDVVVDLKRVKLLKKPNKQLTLLDQSTATKLAFSLKRPSKYDNNHTYGIFGHRYYDRDGNNYEFNRQGISSFGDKNTIEISLPVNKADLEGPITLKINDYPARISGDINIPVK